jgi:hypothetical protein
LQAALCHPGEVVLGVVLGAAREVHVTMQGSLADQDFGACLRSREQSLQPFVDATADHQVFGIAGRF